MHKEDLNKRIQSLADGLKGHNEWESAPDGEERMRQISRDVLAEVIGENDPVMPGVADIRQDLEHYARNEFRKEQWAKARKLGL